MEARLHVDIWGTPNGEEYWSTVTLSEIDVQTPIEVRLANTIDRPSTVSMVFDPERTGVPEDVSSG